MNWDEGITKIKAALANMGYNILGYNFTDAQRQSLEPWFVSKKKGEGLPPEVGVFLNEVKERYPLLAACKHSKVPGQINVDVFCGVKGDGLAISDIQQHLKNFEAVFYKVDENKFGKKVVGWSPKKATYVGLTLCFIYESGALDIETLQSCWKKQGLRKPKPRDMYSTRPYFIDLANKTVNKHKGIPLKTTAPGPNKLASAIF